MLLRRRGRRGVRRGCRRERRRGGGSARRADRGARPGAEGVFEGGKENEKKPPLAVFANNQTCSRRRDRERAGVGDASDGRVGRARGQGAARRRVLRQDGGGGAGRGSGGCWRRRDERAAERVCSLCRPRKDCAISVWTANVMLLGGKSDICRKLDEVMALSCTYIVPASAGRAGRRRDRHGSRARRASPVRAPGWSSR